MMSYIAHEIGNPLNGILGFAHLMATDRRHPLAPGQAKRIEQILASGKHLEGLMRDVMDLGRFASGALAIDVCPIHPIRCAESAMEAVSALAERAGVTLSTVAAVRSIRCAADAARLHQCLVNLLTNAIKYNRPGGWAQIEVTGVKGESPEVAIAVSDNGIGMDAAQRQHLFEPFNRLGRQHDAALGSGLGLVITRQLIEAMNGRIQVDSNPGLGSCFTIVLPGTLHEVAVDA